MLVIDDAPGHPPMILINCDARVEVMFLPQNTSTFKAYYKRRSFTRLNKAMTKNFGSKLMF